MTFRLRSSTLVPLALILILTGTFAAQVSLSTAFASGGIFTVDRTDDAGGLSCTASAGDCTLRSAIQQANASGTFNNIRFDPALFGSGPTTITLSAVLPAITSDGTWIDGQTMLPRIDGRLVGSSGTCCGAAITINASYVTISNIAIINMPISGLGGDVDIYVAGGTSNRISFNYLGTVPGASDCSSGGVTRAGSDGVLISGNVSGSSGLGNGSVYISGNVIGCHSLTGAFAGIDVAGADYVYIGQDAYGNPSWNWIGSQINGYGNVPNVHGIVLRTGQTAGGSRFNVVKYNHVHYNTGNGVELIGTGLNNMSSTYMNVVSFNSISMNGMNGIYLSSGAYQNQIGGTVDQGDNFIYYNGGNGVSINDSDANGILGNYIGTNGYRPEPNSLNGVSVNHGQNNTIGAYITLGPPIQKPNLISGNTLDGITIVNNSSGTVVQGNLIGVNEPITDVLPNLNGISIQTGSHDNLIGGTSNSSANLIGGNLQVGVLISGTTTSANTVESNDIGTKVISNFAYAYPNLWDGIALLAGTHSNSIGTTSAGQSNRIFYNHHSGIRVAGGSHDNLIGNNAIGNNLSYGVLLEGSGTLGNLVTHTSISWDGYDGIAQGQGAGPNQWTQVSIASNGGLGINLLPNDTPGGTPHLPYPSITWINRATNTIHGKAAPGANIELYYAERDPTGYGEGLIYLYSTTVDGFGDWSIVDTSSYDCPFYTAFYTSGGQSTEFGNTVPFCPDVHLPYIRK